MPRVLHFEIQADQPERAVKFFANVFGWDIAKWQGPEDYWLVTTGSPDEPGIDGAIMRRNDPQAHVWNTIGVESVDDTLNRIVQAGGEIVMPKGPVAGIGWLAYFRDTEGNIHGILQPDEEAR